MDMPRSTDHRRSLEDLEDDRWGEPPAGATRLVTVVHRLRRKPVGELTIEDLRVLVGQRVSLDLLVPLAVERLRLDPLAAGDHYAGDLLAAVLSVDPGFWRRQPALAEHLRAVLGSLVDPPHGLAADIERFERPA